MAYDFDSIATGYDKMNHLMTAGLDRLWRRKAVRRIGRERGRVLDVACGTGDMLVEISKRGHEVMGVDLSEEMMAVAKQKGDFGLMKANAEALPFEDGAFDGVTCAFGVRNFVHLEVGLKEMVRVVREGGKVIVLELSTPDNAIVRWAYNIYARRIIPWLGGRIAGNREAYTYLPMSIERFPKGKDFAEIVERIGAECRCRKYFFGVCRCYEIEKRDCAGERR